MEPPTDRQKVYDNLLKSQGLSYTVRSAMKNGEYCCLECLKIGRFVLVPTALAPCKRHITLQSASSDRNIEVNQDGAPCTEDRNK